MPATLEQKISFRAKTLDVFAKIENSLGIKKNIGLIQSAEESNWGISQLATDGFNIFSITPGAKWINAKNGAAPLDIAHVPSWSKLGIETVHYPATEYSKYAPDHIRYFEFPGDVIKKSPDGKGGSILLVDRHFRKYASWDESAWDWARKISQQGIYAKAYLAAKTGDITNYSVEVDKAGYATDGTYAKQLQRVALSVAALPPL